MNIKTTNEITNGVFSTVVTVVGFGSDMLSGEEELNLLNNYSCKLKYKDLDFAGKFKVVDGELKMTEDEDGADVELAVLDMSIPVNKGFKAEYKIALNKIKDDEVNEILTSKEMICEAKCILFSTVVKEGLKNIIEEIRNKATSFEGITEEMI
jgi:hypothetical protein